VRRRGADLARSAYGKLGGIELGYSSDLDLGGFCTISAGERQGHRGARAASTTRCSSCAFVQRIGAHG